MERKRGGRNLKSLGKIPGSDPSRPGANEGTEDREPRVLSQGRKGTNGCVRFHPSRNIEVSGDPSRPEPSAGRGQRHDSAPVQRETPWRARCSPRGSESLNRSEVHPQQGQGQHGPGQQQSLLLVVIVDSMNGNSELRFRLDPRSCARQRRDSSTRHVNSSIRIRVGASLPSCSPSPRQPPTSGY